MKRMYDYLIGRFRSFRPCKLFLISGRHNCCKNLEIIVQLITELNLKFTDLKETIEKKQVSFSNEQLQIISDKLPCGSIEDLEELEASILVNKNQEQSLVNKKSKSKDFC